MKHFIFAAMLLVTGSLCSKAQQISEADQKTTKATYEKIMTAFANSDAATMANCYTENGVHISPDGRIVTGRSALKTFFENLFAWFKSQPQPDKEENSQSSWNFRYLTNDLILLNYTDQHISHFGNKTEKSDMALSVILKRTKDGWLCEQVSMTPVMQQ